jgi:phosphoserine phosphatase RsbU/P
MTPEPARLLVAHNASKHGDTLHGQLAHLGYYVTQAGRGQAARDLLLDGSFDLALLDVSLPQLDVTALLDQFATENVARVPIIVLTAPNQVEHAIRCIGHGAEDYLPLPCDLVLLQTRIHAVLERQRLRKQEQVFLERERVVKFERDLHIARHIQASFLPERLPELPGWNIAAHFQPAREVAGDFYDVFPMVDGRRLGIILADVCDKGVGAALFMALFRSLLRAFANQQTTGAWMNTLGDDWLTSGSANRQRVVPSTGTTALKNAILLTNNYIARTHEQANMFATVFFGVLDPQTGALAYVNGGHEPPVIVQSTGNTVRLMPTGPIVGAFPDLPFNVGAAQLDLGDTLVAFTDGVTEAWSVSGELFTTERVHALLAQPASSAAELLERINLHVQQHTVGSEPSDDITMLAVQRSKPNPTNLEDATALWSTSVIVM